MTLKSMSEERKAHLSRSLLYRGVSIEIGNQSYLYLNDNDGLWRVSMSFDNSNDECLMLVEYTDTYTFTLLDSMHCNVLENTVRMMHIAIEIAGRPDTVLSINRQDMCVLIAMSNDMQNMVERIKDSHRQNTVSLINT